jgi:SPP1 family predicted phage head-tail adaptor
MDFLTDAELEVLRAQMVDLLPETVITQRATVTVSDYGGVSETWTAVGTAWGRIDPASAQSTMIASQESGATYYQLTVEYNAVLADGDRVSVGGVTYQVKSLHADHSKRAVRRAIVVRSHT